MSRWEYKIHMFVVLKEDLQQPQGDLLVLDKLKERLNLEGTEEWELVSIIPNSPSTSLIKSAEQVYWAVYKREKLSRFKG